MIKHAQCAKIKKLTFNGKKCMFQTQQIRFRAYVKVREFTKVLRPDLESNLPENQEDADTLAGNNENAKRKLVVVK